MKDFGESPALDVKSCASEGIFAGDAQSPELIGRVPLLTTEAIKKVLSKQTCDANTSYPRVAMPGPEAADVPIPLPILIDKDSMTDSFIRLLNANKQTIAIIGRVQYNDQFGTPHATTYCYNYRDKEFRACEYGNGAQ